MIIWRREFLFLQGSRIEGKSSVAQATEAGKVYKYVAISSEERATYLICCPVLSLRKKIAKAGFGQRHVTLVSV